MASTNAGLQVFNDQNTLQIDGLFKNYEFKQKGSHTTNNAYEGLPTITFVGNNPIVAVRGAGSRHPWPMDIYLDDGVWKIGFGSYGIGTVEWWIFDTPSAVSSDAYGIEVFDEAGQLAFSGLRKYMKVLGVADDYHRTDSPYYTGVDADGYPIYKIPGAENKIIGSVHCQWGFKPEGEEGTGSGAGYIPGHWGAWVTATYAVSGGVCLRDYFLEGNALYGGSSYLDAVVMLVDVTGL